MAKAKRKTRNGTSQKRAMRPTWEGHLRLSLVTCPVALYSATERAADVHFNLINPKTNNRIRMQTVDAGTGKAVDRSDLVKGYAVSKNKYVLFEKDELDAVRLESTRVIDIERVRRRHVDRPHLLGRALLPGTWRQDRHRGLCRDPHRHGEAGQGGAGPRGDAPARAHLCARAARGRHPAHHAAHPRRDPLVAARCSTATCPSPIRACCRSPRRSSSSRRPSSIPREFKDRYEDALRDLIKRKAKGEDVVSSAEPEEEDKVVDLMDALRKSLKGGGGPSRDKADRFLEAHGRRPRAQSRKKAKPRKRAA